MTKIFKITLIVITEIVYSVLLTLLLNNDNSSNIELQNIDIEGSIDSMSIHLTEKIEFGNIDYGASKRARIKLTTLSNSCSITEILTECSCTTYTIEEHNSPLLKGDTLILNIDMRGVERGLQIRRVHLFSHSETEPHSITLTANVK